RPGPGAWVTPGQTNGGGSYPLVLNAARGGGGRPRGGGGPRRRHPDVTDGENAFGASSVGFPEPSAGADQTS
ncbi:hypothetical protein ABH926_003545, partial [Catenulispora sp. GP43]